MIGGTPQADQGGFAPRWPRTWMTGLARFDLGRLRSWWGAYLVCGVVVAVVTTAGFVDDPINDVLYLGFLGAGSIAVLAAIVRHRPPGLAGTGWVIIVGGLVARFVEECIWTWFARTESGSGEPVVSVMLALSTIAMIVGAVKLVRARQATIDRPVLLDATIIAVSLLAVMWAISVEPAIAEASSPGDLADVGFQLLDVTLIVIIARLVLDDGWTPGAIKLLLVSLTLFAAMDAAYFRQQLDASSAEWGWVDGGYILSAAFLGAAVLHPSMPTVSTTPELLGPLGRKRLLILGGAALLPPALMLIEDIQHVEGHESSHVVLGVTTLALFGLVLVRLATLVGSVERLSAQRTRAQFSSLARHSADAFVVIDRRHRLTYASSACARIWQWNLDESATTTIDDLITDADRPRVGEWIQQVRSLPPSESLSIVAHVRRGDGGVASAEIVGANNLDNDIDGIVLTLRDVSEQLSLEAKLRHQAFHDDLTGLANRARFIELLEARLAKTRMSETDRHRGRPAVLFADLDDFKTINDGLGHTVGDALLTAIAGRLQDAVNKDWTIARLGGDEFALLVPSVADVGEVEEIAAMLAEVLDKPVDLEGVGTVMSASIGAFVIDPGDDAATALRNADLAMYRAKQTGKRRVSVFTDELVEIAEHQLELRQGLQDAIERDEMSLVYQPIFATAGAPGAESMIAIEALARWHLPGRGPVDPLEFVAAAETSGAIHEVGKWVLHQACDFAQRHLPPPVSVSVNVSPVQLRDHRMEQRVVDCLHETGLDADRLIIEVTESVAADVRAAPLLRRLRHLGVRVAIDDFGTGFSSLSYLREFPVDLLKIDQNFVQRGMSDSFMVSAVVDLARGVGAQTIAEGVETSAQYRLLASLGCDFVQGYLFGRPTDGETFRRLFAPMLAARHRPTTPTATAEASDATASATTQ